MRLWLIPLTYAVVSSLCGFALPRLEHIYLDAYAFDIAVSSAQAYLSAIASGMMALTGIVFSVAFVMVQFSAIAYSPRLVLYFARNPSLFHSLGIFVATFIFYWWHRWRQRSDRLWRLFHQIHHSAQRIEVITSFYKHPLEMIVNSLIGSILVYSVMGLSLQGGAIYTACTALGEFFYHTNVKTPRWIGYIFQRPEMHRIHHEYAKHRNNYGDIVWWDMLFGTYENPAEFTTSCGFDDEKEQRLKDMLGFEDVHKA